MSTPENRADATDQRSAHVAVLGALHVRSPLSVAALHAVITDFTPAEVNQALRDLVELGAVIVSRGDDGALMYRQGPPDQADGEPAPAPALDLVQEITSWCMERRGVALLPQDLANLKAVDRFKRFRQGSIDNIYRVCRLHARQDIYWPLYELIVAHCDNDRGICSLSIERMAQFVNRSPRAVDYALQRLHKDGVIAVELRDGDTTLRWPVIHHRDLQTVASHFNSLVPTTHEVGLRPPGAEGRSGTSWGDEVGLRGGDEVGLRTTSLPFTTESTPSSVTPSPPPPSASGTGDDGIPDLDLTDPRDEPPAAGPNPKSSSSVTEPSPRSAAPPSRPAKPKRKAKAPDGQPPFRLWTELADHERDHLRVQAERWANDKGWPAELLDRRLKAFDRFYTEASGRPFKPGTNDWFRHRRRDWWPTIEDWLDDPRYAPKAPRGGGRPGGANVQSEIFKYVRLDDDEIGGGQ